MPKTHSSAYKFFSLWFAWRFGLGIVAYLLIHTTGIFTGLEYEFRRSAVLSELVGFIKKSSHFYADCWFTVQSLTFYLILKGYALYK